MMKRALLILLSAYRHFVSPAFAALGARCRFHPSCSEYAEEAVRRLSLPRAVGLTAVRLAKCGPWCAGGVDRVPAA